jgi:hypothetical protein
MNYTHAIVTVSDGYYRSPEIRLLQSVENGNFTHVIAKSLMELEDEYHFYKDNFAVSLFLNDLGITWKCLSVLNGADTVIHVIALDSDNAKRLLEHLPIAKKIVESLFCRLLINTDKRPLKTSVLLTEAARPKPKGLQSLLNYTIIERLYIVANKPHQPLKGALNYGARRHSF